MPIPKAVVLPKKGCKSHIYFKCIMLRIQSDFPHNKFKRICTSHLQYMFIEQPLIGVFLAKLGFCSSAKLS